MKIILNFFLNFLSNLLALAVFFLLVPLALLAGIAYLLVSLENTGIVADDSRVVAFNLADPLCESFYVSDPISDYINGGAALSTYDIVHRIKSVASDPSKCAIVVYGSFADAPSMPSAAQIAEIRAALAEVAAKKKVYAYLENPSLTDYWLASCASKIWLNPFGEIDFKGLGAQTIFFGNALKKYGVDARVVKVGKLKSFGEMFTSDKMSPAVRENTFAAVDSIWKNIVAEIASSRKLPAQKFLSAADNLAIIPASEAKETGFVDALAYRDEVVAKLRKKYGGDSAEGLKQTSILSYFGAQKLPAKADSSAFGTIAIVYMRGDIVETSSVRTNVIAADFYRGILRELRVDDSVSAVVLRIDSGGGSAYASEVIRREAELLAKKKPLVVSVGSMAASGAYWISTAAEKIVAEPQSITGSIGVFSVMMSARKLAADWGITFDTVKTSPMADIGSIARAPTKSEIARIQSLTDSVYDRFVSLVSRSRGIPREKVVNLADGGIYSGAQALDLRLVDKLGGLHTALDEAKKSAKLDSFSVVEYPAIEPLKELVESLAGVGFSQNAAAPKFLKKLMDARAKVERFTAKGGVYARIPFDIEIR